MLFDGFCVENPVPVNWIISDVLYDSLWFIICDMTGVIELSYVKLMMLSLDRRFRLVLVDLSLKTV